MKIIQNPLEMDDIVIFQTRISCPETYVCVDSDYKCKQIAKGLTYCSSGYSE